MQEWELPIIASRVLFICFSWEQESVQSFSLWHLLIDQRRLKFLLCDFSHHVHQSAMTSNDPQAILNFCPWWRVFESERDLTFSIKWYLYFTNNSMKKEKKMLESILEEIYQDDSFFLGGCPCGVMVNAMDCWNVISKFDLQLRYYVHFRTNTLGKGMNPLILPAMG